MMRVNNKTYKYVKTPEADYGWMKTNWANSTCCLTQRDKIQQHCPTCNIETPVGEIDINLFNSNFAYIGSSTIVWDNTKDRECEYKVIYNSTGIVRTNIYAGRLIDSGAQLEYLFDLTEAIIPCPGLNLTYTDIHLVDGLTNTFIAFNNQTKHHNHTKVKRDILDDEFEDPAPFMENLLIRPYVYSFHSLTQDSDKFKLLPCVKFDHDINSTMKNIIASNNSQNFQVSHDRKISIIGSKQCIDYSQKDKALTQSDCDTTNWNITKIEPHSYSIYTLELRTTDLLFTKTL